MSKQPARILPISPVRRPPRRLCISNPHRLRPQHPEESIRRHRSRPHLHVIRLLQHTPTLRPEPLQRKQQLLKRQSLLLSPQSPCIIPLKSQPLQLLNVPPTVDISLSPNLEITGQTSQEKLVCLHPVYAKTLARDLTSLGNIQSSGCHFSRPTSPHLNSNSFSATL